MPRSIAKEIRNASAIVGDGALERHRDLTDGHSSGVLFLANNIADVVWVAYTGVEVKDQREPARRFCLDSRRDPKQHQAYRKQ